jgi:hypothetical protein
MEEIWKDIESLKGAYQINQFGAIKSLERTVIRKNGHSNRVQEKILIKKTVHSTGYIMFGLNRFGKSVPCRLHRLLAEAFIPNPKKLPFINHIDGNKTNNELSNLEWVTKRENSVHRFIGKQQTSKYPGVSWSKQRLKWCSSISVNGKHMNLGGFLNEEDAHNAYLDAHIRFGIENKYSVLV